MTPGKELDAGDVPEQGLDAPPHFLRLLAVPRPHGLHELRDVVLLFVLDHPPPGPQEAKLAVFERPGAQVRDGLPVDGLLRPYEGDRHIAEAPGPKELKGVRDVGVCGPHKEGGVLGGDAPDVELLELLRRHRRIDRLEGLVLSTPPPRVFPVGSLLPNRHGGSA